MKTYLFNPSNSVQARTDLGLSQALVSREAEINRTYLSQFESGKRVLEDQLKETLIDYYLGKGWQPPNPEQEQSESESYFQTRDGFIVVDGFADFEIEELLDEYYENSIEIQELEDQELKRGFFGGIDESYALIKTLRTLLLSARQYWIIQQLHGHLESDRGSEADEEENLKTIGDYVEHLFNTAIHQGRAESGTE